MRNPYEFDHQIYLLIPTRVPENERQKPKKTMRKISNSHLVKNWQIKIFHLKRCIAKVTTSCNSWYATTYHNDGRRGQLPIGMRGKCTYNREKTNQQLKAKKISRSTNICTWIARVMVINKIFVYNRSKSMNEWWQ